MDEKRQHMIEVARQETWIKTPYSYIKTGKKLTLFQQDVMLMVSAHLQQYLQQYFDLGLDKSDADPLPLFARHLLDNGIPPFRIYFSEMGINTANYKTVREAIDEMNLLVEIGETDERGRATGATLFVPVFKCFRVPPLGGKYVRKDEQGVVISSSDRYAGYVEVEVNNKVAQYSFNMARGYLTHPLPIARYATKQSTPRMYFFLQRQMGKEKSATVRCTLMELKNFLGFEPYKDEQTHEWVVPYQKFAHFKTKVLDVVQRDLDDMARQNHSDITFTYKPIYKNGRKRGDPDEIEFRIAGTPLALGYGLMTGTSTPAIVVAKEREQQARQLDLFAQQEAEQERQHWAQVWQQCREDLLGLATHEESRRAVLAIRYECYSPSEKSLILQVPDIATYEYMERPDIIATVVKPALTRHFGRNVRLSYRLRER